MTKLSQKHLRAKIASALSMFRGTAIKQYWKHNKIFCIGRNKTGTTTLDQILRELGFRVAPQNPAEHILDKYWNTAVFEKNLVQFCKRYDAFQDVPFSMTGVYEPLDRAFPDSKFILTVRNPDNWYRSLTNHHLSESGIKEVPVDFGETPPTSNIINAIRRWKYHRPGFVYDNQFRQYGLTSDSDLYKRELYVRNFQQHLEEVDDYFRKRPTSLLTLDLSEETDTRKICRFLGIPEELAIPMPHENKRR